ncbi:hypothetical protein AAE478_008846 [Parahypoxylon ruwenzoriense]
MTFFGPRRVSVECGGASQCQQCQSSVLSVAGARRARKQSKAKQSKARSKMEAMERSKEGSEELRQSQPGNSKEWAFPTNPSRTALKI